MGTRDRRVAEVITYLREHFPDAAVRSAKDGLTGNEVFIVQHGATTRHVEVTKRWIEGDDAGLPLPSAIRQWDLAREVSALAPNGTVRVGTTGFERVAG